MLPRIVLTPHDDSIQPRKVAAAAWIAAAVALAHQSGDREAIDVAGFLNTRTQVAVPESGTNVGLPSVPPPGQDQTAYIVPMLTSDTWRFWRGDHDFLHLAEADRRPRPTVAVFVPTTRAIYLPADWPLSELAKGLVLLHEGLHAFDRIVWRRRMPKPFVRRERNAWLLQIRVLESIGRAPYANYLQKLVPEVANQLWKASDKESFRCELGHHFTDGRLSRLLDKPIAAASTLR